MFPSLSRAMFSNKVMNRIPHKVTKLAILKTPPQIQSRSNSHFSLVQPTIYQIRVYFQQSQGL